MKILIVEDEIIIALGMQRKFANLGHESDYVHTGKEAVEVAGAYDAAILDIRLKGKMDGIQAGAEIAKRHNIPIAYLSGNNDSEIKQRAMATNPAGYYVKPVNNEELGGIVSDLSA